MAPIESRIVREAFDTVLRKWASLRVDKIVIGSKYSLIRAGESLGIFYSHMWENPGPVRETGWALRYAWRLLARLDTTLSERSAAWGAVAAATNAWIDETPGAVKPVRYEAEELGLYNAASIAMVGFVEPLAEKLASAGVRVTVFERSLASRRWEGVIPVYPDTYAVNALREGGYDAVLVTGSSLAHPGAAASLAEAAREGGARLRILLGPSASIHPWICSRLGYTHVASSHPPREVRVELEDMVARGYGYRKFRKLLVKYVASCTS